MADRTVRAIFEAKVDTARKGITGLAKDLTGAGKKVDDLTKGLKAADAQKVKPEVDVKIDDAKKRLKDLTRELGDLKQLDSSPEVDVQIVEAKKRIADVRAEIKSLTSQKTEVKIDASIKETQKRIRDITLELGQLRTLEVTPEVTADIREAKRRLADARASLRELNGAKATMEVDADTRQAKSDLSDLSSDVADAGAEGGDEAGSNIVGGILDALRTIPIAGAIVGVGVAIAGGILIGIQQGLAIEAERDIFSAQTGLDEDTSARFGRAAGEAYANAWGDSVAANLDTARAALSAGLIDSTSTDAEIENVIAKLTGLSDLFDYDIASSVKGVGNLLRTGLVKDANEAFDLITVASQKLPSDDLIDTLNEYSTQFKAMGLTGQQAFGLLVQAAKAGARDTDNVADTIKEAGLRIREGAKPATDALKSLGLNSKDIVKSFQEGGPRSTAALGKVFDALRKLKEQGGNTQAVVTNLFGGPGEDLGTALYALNIKTVNDALGGTKGAAGAAERALTTMSDNTSSKIESAKRNIETAVDGIRGALAEAFGDDIAGAADYVSKNRAVLLEFFKQVIDGTFDMGKSFLTFSATALDSIADVIVGIADLIDSLPGDQSELKKSLYGIADGLKAGAEDIRSDFIPALDEAKIKADRWIAPEILKARIHDATLAMTEDMDAFSETVKKSGGTITINGDKMNAEDALAELVANINAEDGTVTINGDDIPAQDALDRLIALISVGQGKVEIGANTGPAETSAREALRHISASEAAITVYADTGPAELSLATLKKRYATLGVRVSGVSSVGGAHEGGRIMRGLYSGGRVPGTDPGYDNVLWPLNVGGRTLQQPLAGGEYVVNSQAASQNLALLEAINSGARPAVHNESHEMPVYIQNLNAVDAGSFRREMPAEVAWRKSVRRSIG